MARIRNPSRSRSPARNASPRRNTVRQRSAQRLPPTGNIQDDAPNLHHSREDSPGKIVHFTRRLISGPSAGDRRSRSQSPGKSALRSPPVEWEQSTSTKIPYSEALENFLDYSVDDSDSTSEYDDEEEDATVQLMRELNRPSGPTAGRVDEREVPKVPSARDPVPSTSHKAKAKPEPLKPVPQYVATQSSDKEDMRFCESLNELKTKIAVFVDGFKDRPKISGTVSLTKLCIPKNAELVRYLGCLAMGGQNGAEGWRQLLTDNASRKALVWAVVGRALKEHVFDSLYFGGEPALIEKLEKMEVAQARQDGFFRQRERRDAIERWKKTADAEQYLEKAQARVVLGLEKLLDPLWRMGMDQRGSSSQGLDFYALLDIVRSAGTLAREMRHTDAIYYWPPTFKDEEFEPARMECLNLKGMIEGSPYDRQSVNGRERPILRDGADDKSEAIVRVVCFPGLQVYRQGGGALAKQQLEAERRGDKRDNAPPDVQRVRRQTTDRYGNEYTGEEGWRSRIICKSVVLLQWGKQRLLTKEAGTSAHTAAVKAGKVSRYVDDAGGSVELWDVFTHYVPGAGDRAEEPTTTGIPAKDGGATSGRRSSGMWDIAKNSLNYLWGHSGDDGAADRQARQNYAELAQQRSDSVVTGRLAPGPSSPRSKKRKIDYVGF